jgi:hypothetical protein
MASIFPKWAIPKIAEFTCSCGLPGPEGLITLDSVRVEIVSGLRLAKPGLLNICRRGASAAFRRLRFRK